MLPEDRIDARAAGRLLGLHVSTVLRWLLEGKLRGYRVGGRYWLSRADVLAKVEVVGGETGGHVAAVEELKRAGVMR